MGESKVRKAIDPTYGIVPKSKQKRGLIVSNAIYGNIFNTSIKIESEIDPEELRYSLLYWDKLLKPCPNVIDFVGGDDEQYLISLGILTKPVYNFSEGELFSIIRSTYINAYFDMEEKEPGVWSLSQGEKTPFLKNIGAEFSEDGGLSLQLLNAIPLPVGDVPLAEILEFKERRKDELFILRAHIDLLVLEIQNSPAKTDDFNRIAKEIDSACADLLKVSREWQYPVHFADLKATFNFNPMRFLGAVGGMWKIGEPYGLVAATSVAAAAGLVSTIDVKSDISFRSFKKPMSPFGYALLAHKELV